MNLPWIILFIIFGCIIVIVDIMVIINLLLQWKAAREEELLKERIRKAILKERTRKAFESIEPFEEFSNNTKKE